MPSHNFRAFKVNLLFPFLKRESMGILWKIDFVKMFFFRFRSENYKITLGIRGYRRTSAIILFLIEPAVSKRLQWIWTFLWNFVVDLLRFLALQSKFKFSWFWLFYCQFYGRFKVTNLLKIGKLIENLDKSRKKSKY